MPLQPSPLPCAPGAFAPQLSPEQVEHHRRHLQGHFDALAAALGPQPEDGLPEDGAEPPTLEHLVRTGRGALAAHAAQAWAGDFYWSGLRAAQPGLDNEPAGALAEALSKAFGDVRRFRERFNEAALRDAAPGWAWLVQRRDQRLAILVTAEPVTPLTGGDTPLLACSLSPQSHALDYTGARDRYLAAFWQLVDWRRVGLRLPKARTPRSTTAP